MIVNTRLNLPGEVLVETKKDMINFIKNSKLKYIYIPETNQLYVK